MTTKTLQIRVGAEEAEVLANEAIRTGMSISAVVRTMLAKRLQIVPENPTAVSNGSVEERFTAILGEINRFSQKLEYVERELIWVDQKVAFLETRLPGDVEINWLRERVIAEEKAGSLPVPLLGYSAGPVISGQAPPATSWPTNEFHKPVVTKGGKPVSVERVSMSDRMKEMRGEGEK
jgi:hypothetical protein